MSAITQFASSRQTTQDAYHHLQSLNKIASLAEDDQTPSLEALDKISSQFESLLAHQLIKAMRSANEVFAQGSFLTSEKVKFYRQMLDDQLSLSVTQGAGLGFRESFSEQMKEAYVNSTSRKSGDPGKEEVAGFSIASVKINENYIHADKYSNVLPLNHEADFDKSTKSASVSTEQVLDNGFSTSRDFIEALMPLARRAAHKLGVNPEELIAQAALETGWGKKMIRDSEGNNSYNLFGVKADNRWHGKQVEVSTLEYFSDVPIRLKASFRGYGSYKESFDDYVNFIRTNPRYSGFNSATSYPEHLQVAGYATDPNYAKKINSIVSRIQSVGEKL